MLDIAINAYIALFCAIFLFVSFTVYSLLGKRVKKLKVDTHLGDYEVGAGSDSDDSPDRNYSHTSSYIRQRPSHHTYSTNIYAGSRQVPNKNARTANVSGHGAYSPINEHGKRFDINTPIHGIEMSPNTQRRPSYRDDLPQQLHSYQQQSPSYQYTQQNYQQTQYQQQQVRTSLQTILLKTTLFTFQNRSILINNSSSTRNLTIPSLMWVLLLTTKRDTVT